MDIRELKKAKKEVARYMRRLYQRGLTTATGGNVSVKAHGYLLITPSAIDKALIRGKQILIMNADSENLTPGLKPSIEWGMHLAIYKVRPDVKAIVHAHPPLATCFTAMDHEINCQLIAEARAVLGKPVTAPYALMGTPKLAQIVSKAAESNENVILLENHGIVCLGNNLPAAFDRLEVLEVAARMTLIAKMMGTSKPLSREQSEEIDKLMLL
jgi:L-fuculose-phosphate aldolase